jgi:hypothetical protein
MRTVRLISCLTVLTSACTFEGDQTAPPPLSLDDPLGPGQTRAGLVTKPSELIGGVTAKAKVGDYKIYNDKVAFMVGRAGVSRGYHPYGGQILDVDLVRSGPGKSSFGEIITAFDLSVLRVDTVEVINDGTNGEPARLRVKGEADVFPLFDALFSKIFETKTYDMDWAVDYVLEPNAQHLRVEHRLKNRGREDIEFGLPILAFLFGDGAAPFVENYGFAPPSGSGSSSYYAGVDKDVSYLIGRPDSRLNFVVTEAGVVVTGAGDGFKIRGREEITIVQQVVVGGGNLSETQLAWRKASGQPEGVRLGGRVVNEADEPVANARVHIVETEPANMDRDYVTRVITDPDGNYEAFLPEGRYDFVVATDGKAVTPRRTIEATTSQEGLDLVVPRVGRLRYAIKDSAGRDLPAKLSIESVAGAFEQLPRRYGENRQDWGLVTTEFAHTGNGEIELLPGQYRVSVSRGIEYEIAQPIVDVVAGQTANMSAVLTRSVNTTGWMSTDTHIHAQLSPDSPDLYPLKVRAMVVENLEVPVSTEHEAIGDFNPAIQELGVGAWMKGIIGSEVTTFTYGHFNAFPLVPIPELPGNGRVVWYHKPPGETFAAIRANPGDAFIQVNHPRSAAIGGYFSAMGFDRDAFSARQDAEFSMDFDGIEVMNGCGNGTLDQAEIQDWFSFLNHGVKRYGTASTDNHHASGGDMGLPLTFVKMPTDNPAEAKADDFRASFKAGRLILSCGPFVEMTIGDRGIGDTVLLESESLPIRAHVEAATWMDVDVLDVVVNGAIAQSIPLTRNAESAVLFDGPIAQSLPAGKDAWVALSVRGDQSHGVWARGRPSFAVTNAIYIDGDRDGSWTMRQ